MKGEIFTLYLGGSIRHKKASDVIKMFNESQQYIEDRFKERGIAIKVLSPIRGKHCDNSGEEWTSKFTLPEIIARDENDLKQSDMDLILSGDVPTCGTWLEFGLAIYECKIPVVMVAPLRKAGKVVSWSNYKATFIGENLEQVIDWVLNYWLV